MTNFTRLRLREIMLEILNEDCSLYHSIEKLVHAGCGISQADIVVADGSVNVILDSGDSSQRFHAATLEKLRKQVLLYIEKLEKELE